MKLSLTVLLALTPISIGCNGCGKYEYLKPVGPSLCPVTRDAGLEESIDLAVFFWNSTGLRLDSACAPGSLPLVVTEETKDTAGTTWFNNGEEPRVTIAPIVAMYAASTDSNERSRAAEVIGHELGHAMGLVHLTGSNDTNSAMWPEWHLLQPGPTDGDFDQAEYLMQNYGWIDPRTVPQAR